MYSAVEDECDGFDKRYGDSCYKYYSNPRDYDSALDTCQAEGAYLVEIRNAAEQAILRSKIPFYLPVLYSIYDLHSHIV